MNKRTTYQPIESLIRNYFQDQVDGHPVPTFPTELFRGERCAEKIAKRRNPLMSKLVYAALLAVIITAGVCGINHPSPADKRYSEVLLDIKLEEQLPALLAKLSHYIGENIF